MCVLCERASKEFLFDDILFKPLLFHEKKKHDHKICMHEDSKQTNYLTIKALCSEISLHI